MKSIIIELFKPNRFEIRVLVPSNSFITWEGRSAQGFYLPIKKLPYSGWSIQPEAGYQFKITSKDKHQNKEGFVILDEIIPSIADGPELKFREIKDNFEIIKRLKRR